MKHSIITTAAAALLALCSCNKESAPAPVLTPADGTGRRPIVFLAEGEGLSAEVTTRATAVTSLTSFNVNCVTGTAGSAETSVFNAAFSGTASTSYKGGKYWPATDPSYKFYASNATLTPAAAGPTVAATNATDVVCAVLTSPTFAASNKLTFNHIFARLGTVTVTAPADGSTVSNLAIKITPKTGGTYSLYKGNGKTDGTGWSSTTTGSATTIASATGSNSNDIYLVPGTYTLTATYTQTLGAYTESCTKTATVSLVGGKINSIATTIPDSGATEIVFTVSITAWGTNSVTANFS